MTLNVEESFHDYADHSARKVVVFSLFLLLNWLHHWAEWGLNYFFPHPVGFDVIHESLW
jgi:hypothetical protein